MDKNYETEYKYLINPSLIDYSNYPFSEIEQAYLSTSPVIRIRKRDQAYYLTVKGSGLIRREEFEMPISAEEYHNLKTKAEGYIITKKRYLIPYHCNQKEYTIELDIFTGELEGLSLAEVEFSSLVEAENFIAPDWFLKNVSTNCRYHNSYLSKHGKN